MSAGVPKGVEKAVNIVVCLGAAIVIFGAWQKITHQPLADFFLTAGLLTEALIFIVYAFLPPPGGEMEEMTELLRKGVGGGSNGNPALEKIDAMMQQAGITPSNMDRLSESFVKLGATADKLADLSDVVKSTSDYSAKTKEVTAALDTMKNAYQTAASSMGHLNASADSTRQFHEQVQVLTKNLGSLNAVYELELQDTNNHLKAMNNFYGNLVAASETMKGSVSDAQKAHDQIEKLANNLTSLNNVYGNMLNAMQVR
jgi:hypothetical protein